VDVCLVIKQRLMNWGLSRKIWRPPPMLRESYISQLLARKKLPRRLTEQIFTRKWRSFLKLPSDRLSKLADTSARKN